jgi:hypothetical protein
MVATQVGKIMTKSLLSLAEKQKVSAERIALVVHTKPNSDEAFLQPLYFGALDKSPIRQDGVVHQLDFKKDILGVKIDTLMMAKLAANYFADKFKTLSSKYDISPRDIYVFIGCNNAEANDFKIEIFNISEKIEETTLKELFKE